MRKYNNFTQSMRVPRKFYDYVKEIFKKNDGKIKIYAIVEEIMDFHKNNYNNKKENEK